MYGGLFRGSRIFFLHYNITRRQKGLPVDSLLPLIKSRRIHECALFIADFVKRHHPADIVELNHASLQHPTHRRPRHPGDPLGGQRVFPHAMLQDSDDQERDETD